MIDSQRPSYYDIAVDIIPPLIVTMMTPVTQYITIRSTTSSECSFTVNSLRWVLNVYYICISCLFLVLGSSVVGGGAGASIVAMAMRGWWWLSSEHIYIYI
jgi:hypothetical protein